MIRRLPIIPTIIVLAAVATMIGLGLWQLRRAHEKDALLARYASAQGLPPTVWPTVPVSDDKLPLFRRATAFCLEPVAQKGVAGTNLKGDSGFSQLVDCKTGGAEGPGLRVDIGWSANPNAGKGWRGGPISGIIGPDGEKRMRLVATTAFAGLQPSAPPDINDIPNNHRSYAVQWLAFAAIALLIYALALRSRLRATK